MIPQWVISSVGRALRLHRRCRRFEPVITHHFFTSFALIDKVPRGCLHTTLGRGNRVALIGAQHRDTLGLRWFIHRLEGKLDLEL